MAKTMTLRNVLAAFLLLAASASVSAQAAFWSATFNAADGWSSGGTNGGSEVWTWTNDPLAGFQDPNIPAFDAATASTGYYYFNSDANGENDHDVQLTNTTAPASCTGKSGVHMRFHTQFIKYTAGSQAFVGVSVDGTTFTYTEILVGLPVNTIFQGDVDVELPEADGKSQVWVQFRWVGNYEYHWKVDDVELYEFATPVHDVTFRVNASLLTVDPGGMRLAGSFNGWSDDVMTNEGNGIWSITKQLDQGSVHQYKFKNGPGGWEQAPEACGVPDGFGGFNRGITVGTEDAVLPAICFASCDPCVVPCPQNPNKIVCDNFDQYNTTQKVAQQNVAQNGAANSWWTTWSGALGTAEDGIVSTEQANSGANSMKIVAVAAGGPQDVVLKLGNKTTGRYELKWMCYIPAGKQGYYNIQNIVPIAGGSWNLDAFFEANNSGHIQIGAGASLATFSYPNGEWFEVRHIIDLDNNLLTLWVDGQYVHKMAYPNNLGGIDFYGIDANHTYYIDDIEYVQLPALVYNVDVCDAAIDLTLYLAGAAGVAQTTPLYDNSTATVSASDPAVDCWNETTGADILNTTMWYTFTGDGAKYHIETVPCSATNYIGTAQQDPGDTQMLVYAGDNCNDLTEVACNDDLFTTGDPDWRSGLDLQTNAGENYYMLIDGFEFQGVVAKGQFCIEITEVASVSCAEGAVGTYTVSSPYLCESGQLADLINVNPDGFTLPNQGPVWGMAWAITSAPISPNTWPADVPGLLIGSTGFLQDVFTVSYVNTGTPFPFNVYYITPIVAAGLSDTDPANGPTLFDTDPTNGCAFIGQSTQMVFLPLTDDITATAVAGVGSVNLTPAGGIAGITGDPSSYTYLWSNGATTQDLTNVGVGTYTCTVSDQCSLEGTASATVTVVGTEDPASIQSFVISPNPTAGVVNVNLALVSAAEVRVEVLNTLGQTLKTSNYGKLSALNQNVDLSDMAQGTYFLRVTIDGETALRRVAVQR